MKKRYQFALIFLIIDVGFIITTWASFDRWEFAWLMILTQLPLVPFILDKIFNLVSFFGVIASGLITWSIIGMLVGLLIEKINNKKL